MRSKVHLFNTAIARLGGEQLELNISPQEQSSLGRICDNLFPHVLDITLEANPWAFAMRRKALSSPVRQDELSNPHYPFVFELPSDCVKPMHLEGYAGVNRRPGYVIEGETLRCVTDKAVFVYISRIDDPKLWPPLFADALAWRMAGELASAVNNDAGKQQMCYQAYEVAMSKAIAMNRAEQNPHRNRSEWTEARFGGKDHEWEGYY